GEHQDHRREVDLGLLAGLCLEPHRGRHRARRTEGLHEVLENRSTAVVAHGPEFAKQDLAVVNTVFQHAPFDILLVRGQLRRPGRPRLALRQSGVAQVLAHRIPRDAELLGNASDRVVVPIQGVNLFHFPTLQQGPQPPNPLAGSLESRIRWRVGHFHPAPGSRVNRPQHGIDRRTVRKYLDAPQCPHPKPRGRRPSILDPYRDYILARWAEGCHNAAELYREIVRQGYPGSRTIVKDFVATLRRRARGEPVVRHVRLGPKRLRRWFSCPPDELGARERRCLELVLEASPAARETYTLLQDFRGILTERKAETRRSWLERAGGSSLAPLRGFARSLEQDMDAVMNALTLPWSNGPVEGHINKLKLLKRQMYGRAGIELLRRRFLAMGR